MNNPEQLDRKVIGIAVGRFFSRAWTVWEPVSAALLFVIMGATVSSAASVTLKTADAVGTSSFIGSTNWSDGNVPTVGNAYFTGANTIRTTNYNVDGGAVTVTFAGDSLSIDTGGRLIGKIGNNGSAGKASTGTMTGNFILNGGTMDEAAGVNGNDVLIISGTVTVNASSFLGASGATANNSANFETLEITAPISGSAALQIAGANVNGGADTGNVKLSAANPYTGTITVPNSRANAVIASAVNRTLQLNHLDALSQATLNLTSTNNDPVSFAAGVNSGPFNLGGLTGSSAQMLSDTAGGAIVLSVGNINTSSTYNGSLTGNGGLTKVGTGTLTLGGANTYTGNTTLSKGVLALSATGALASANIIVGGGTTFDVSSNVFTLAAGQGLLGSGTVKGAVTAAAGANVYAGLDGVYGTNTFTTNLAFASGAAMRMDLGTAYNGPNDRVAVGGNLVLNNTAFRIKAPDSSVNLDQSADYVLLAVAGTITGNPAATPTWEVPPANANHYSIAKSGQNIVLHYNSSLLPSGYGSASPNPVVHNQGVLISVTVTYSATAVSSVTANATALGGSASVALVAAGGGVYTNTVVVAPGVANGDKTLTATITDSSSPTHLAFTTPDFTVTVNSSSDVWSGGGTDNKWSRNANWQDGTAPGYVGDAVTFAGTARLNPDLDSDYTLTGLTFDGSAGSFVLGSSSGSVLTLTGNISNDSGYPQTLGMAIANAGNALLFYGGNNLTNRGGIAGTGGLENNNSGVLFLGGTNTFTGGININSGTLQIGGAGLLGGTNGNYAGNITNSGMLVYSSSATQTLSGVISWFGNIVKDGPGRLILGGNNTYFANTYISNGVLQITGTLAGNVGNDYVYDIANNGTLQMSSAAAQTLSGIISGTGGLIMDGAGTLNFNSGSSTYSGATVVNGGTLVYSPNTISYSTPISSLIINKGGTVQVNANAGAALPVGNLVLNTNGVLRLNYDFSGGNPTTPALAVAGNLSSPGTNIIRITGFGAASTQFPLISYGTLTASLSHFVLSLPPGMTGTLVNNSANHTLDLNVTAVSPATWIPLTASDAAGTTSFNAAGHWQDGNVPAEGNGYYTQGYALRSPADANAYTFAGSALSLDPYGTTGTSSGGHLLLKGSGNATITIPNLILNGGLLDYADSANNGTRTLAGNILLNNGTTSYMGALAGPGYAETLIIAAPISGGGSLQIGGDLVNAGADYGVVALNAANTYTGNTLVASGNLLVNGTLGSGAVSVATNGTLGGIGVINGPVTVQTGGTLAPGTPNRGAQTTALGKLTVNNTVAVAGTLWLRIDRAGGITSDELMAGSLILSPGATLTVTNIGSTNLVAGDKFTLFSSPVSGAFSLTNLPALPSATLAWTNKLTVDGTIAVFSTSVGPSGPETLTNSFNAVTGTLSLSWPANEGWRLQIQTNSLAKGLGTNWVYVTDGTISSTNIAVNKTNGTAFYRLAYP